MAKQAIFTNRDSMCFLSYVQSRERLQSKQVGKHCRWEKSKAEAGQTGTPR